MGITTVCRATVAAIVALSVACGRGPTSPSASEPPAAAPPPVAAPPPAPPPGAPLSFPPLSGPSRTFVFDAGQTALLRASNRHFAGDVSDYTKQSRFVLYDNGACALLYPSLSGAVLGGRYERAGDVLSIIFEFQGRTADEPWDDAIGRLRGDLLTIEFDLIMQHSDFENAAYVLAP
jgi:hypothetical protein